MRTVAPVLSAIIMLAVVACGDDSTDAPAPAPTDTPLPAPTAPVSAALKAPDLTPTNTPVVVVAVEVATVPSPTSTATPATNAAQPLTPTQAPTPAPTSTHTPSPTPVPTDTPTSSSTATQTTSPVPTQPPTAAPTLVPVATDTAVPTATHTATATNTPVPTATETPVPTATSLPTSTPTNTPTSTNTPVPTPSVDPALASYSPLLVKAVSSYPSGLDFVGDGLSADELEILDWADSRLFTNPNFLASKYGPDYWPSDVKLASVQAVPMLMLAIDIQQKSDGKHVINWEKDSLDRILDELDVYKGVTVSRHGKDAYDTVDKVVKNYFPIVNDPAHVHREMLKTFSYLAKADGEGILIRSIMENDADDLELLYNRDLEIASGRVFTDTAFGWRNLSFMSQIKLPDGTVESFPTQVYEIVGDAGNQREAAERWFDNFNAVMSHFVGGVEDFADIYRPYSQTPYTPEPGYLLIVKEAGSPSSTGTTVSALRSLGLKAEQFLSPENGYRTGGVEIDGEWYYHDGNMPLGNRDHPMCIFFAPLEVVENRDFDKHCGYPTSPNESSVDRTALAALFDATGGTEWRRSQNWISDVSMRQWQGVVVNHESGRVTHLMLTSNGLRGELPSELQALEELEELLLAGNERLTGCVTRVLRERLKRLTGLGFCDP